MASLVVHMRVVYVKFLYIFDICAHVHLLTYRITIYIYVIQRRSEVARRKAEVRLYSMFRIIYLTIST